MIDLHLSQRTTCVKGRQSRLVCIHTPWKTSAISLDPNFRERTKRRYDSCIDNMRFLTIVAILAWPLLPRLHVLSQRIRTLEAALPWALAASKAPHREDARAAAPLNDELGIVHPGFCGPGP